MSGYILEVGNGKVMFIEVPTFTVLRTYEMDDEDLPSRARTFPSSKFEIHFDTLNRNIKRIDCLGDNIVVEECFPMIKRTKAFEKKYPHARLLEQDWDDMIREMKKLTSKSKRRP